MTTDAATYPDINQAFIVDSLPSAARVLAVTARPGQESADLGGVLFAFRRSGASLSLLCLTRGEAAPRNSGMARLEAARPWEVQMAAAILGVHHVAVTNYRDGRLHKYDISDLAARILQAVIEYPDYADRELLAEVRGTAGGDWPARPARRCRDAALAGEPGPGTRAYRLACPLFGYALWGYGSPHSTQGAPCSRLPSVAARR